MRLTRSITFGVALYVASMAAVRGESPYDPLQTTLSLESVETIDLQFAYGKSGREVPVLLYLPPKDTKAPIIIFSHGLGGSRTGSAYLGKHWAVSGYAAAFIQHPGSDASIMEGLPPLKRYSALKSAASLKSTVDRVNDVPALIDQLAEWTSEEGHPLEGRLDVERIGMAGHSFGALTTQYLSGQTIGRRGRTYADSRIKAALPMSPSPPRRGATETAFGKVAIPWLLMTGTDDGSPISDTTPENRMEVFPALPSGDKFELVLWEAEHSAFTERSLPGDRNRRNPNHHRAILAISTAFWDAHLRDDAVAGAWLDSDGPRSVLEPKDRWRKK